MSDGNVFANPKCLVMFSGGKDSFLSSCYLIEQGYDITLLSFNNGALAGERNLEQGARRLQRHYGESSVTYAGCYCTSSAVMRLNESWAYMPSLELGTRYPNIIPAQLTCLHCQTAMWAAAIAYAVSHDISVLAAGYRSTDLFCTGNEPWIAAVSEVAKSNGVNTIYPVWHKLEWEDFDNWERDQAMIMRSFEPQVVEARCMLGRPVKAMSALEESDMMRYFCDNVVAKLGEEVQNLIPVFRTIQLSSSSLDSMYFNPVELE